MSRAARGEHLATVPHGWNSLPTHDRCLEAIVGTGQRIGAGPVRREGERPGGFRAGGTLGVLDRGNWKGPRGRGGTIDALAGRKQLEQRMARSLYRSVTYGLDASLALAQVVAAAGGRTDVDTLASALSYSGVRNGAFLSRLANARLFGLVGGRSGEVVLTDRGRPLPLV